jgi:hypothetical protein
MNKRPEAPRLNRGTMPRVEIARDNPDAADEAATRLLFETYTDKDGFHCPACGAVITDPNKAIDHLKDEINAAITKLPTLLGQAKPKED